MELFDTIHTRRSVRDFTDEPLGEDQVELILRAAMAAPSAGNEQPWHFVVVEDRDTMLRIIDVHPYSGMLAQAPLCVAVCFDRALEQHTGFSVQDASAATQNMLLAAHALGLGAVWLGVHPVRDREEGVAEILGLPEGVTCLSIVALGHPAGRTEPVDRYNPQRVHRNQW
jgi:nitroreductase